SRTEQMETSPGKFTRDCWRDRPFKERRSICARELASARIDRHRGGSRHGDPKAPSSSALEVPLVLTTLEPHPASVLTPIEQLQRAVANFFVHRQVVVPRRAKGIEHAGWYHHFHTMRDITRKIKRAAGGKLVRHIFNNESHFAFENVNDLLLRV